MKTILAIDPGLSGGVAVRWFGKTDCWPMPETQGDLLERLREVKRVCSFKQAKVLRKYGYDAEVSFAEASAIIDGLARNGWRRAAEPAVAPAKGNPAWN